MLKFNNTEVENVYFNGTKLDRVFFNNTLVYESTIYVDKPTLSGVFVYDKTVKQVTVTGYDSTAMTLSGAIEATEAGTYHAYFTPNKGYAWTDGTTDKLDLTWTINKRPIAIPSLSGTSFTWAEGATHTVTVNNLDTDYVTQSGNVSQTDTSSNIGATNTVTWALKNTNSTYWTNGSTTNITATWGVYWANGTSHYSNDLYNCGWNSGQLVAGTTSYGTAVPVDWGSASQPYIMVTSAGVSSSVIYVSVNGTIPAGQTFHATVRSDDASNTVAVCAVVQASTGKYTSCDSSSGAHKSAEWGEIWGKNSYAGYFGIRGTGTKNCYIQRIWLT